MAQPTFYLRFLALFVLLGGFSLVPVALPRAACAKGVPTIARITGPQLTKPIRFSGPDFPAPVGYWPLPALTGAHHYKAAVFAASSGPVEHDDDPGPEVELGPRYKVEFSVWKDDGIRVLQYLYPFATSGPVTFTPPGQGRAFARVFGEREISGWWSAPNELTKWLRENGVTTPSRHSFPSPSRPQIAQRDVPQRDC
jgi:hypothetical protein